MSPVVEWVDELPGRPYEGRRLHYRFREQSMDLVEHAAKLIQQPMRWAKYPRQITELSAKRISGAIREGTIAAYHPDYGFESAYRQGAVYIRHNPDAVNPRRTAYTEGYAVGRRDALSEVHQAVWRFRKALQDIEQWEESRSDR